jgi:hypothetical protein
MHHLPAALVTKFKAPDAEKPVIRPYTPVSDEGKLTSFVYHHRNY